MIFALFEDLLDSLRVWDNKFQLGGTSLYRTFSLVHLAEAMVRAGPEVLLAGEDFYLEESSRVFGLLYPTKRSGTFLQEREPGAIVEWGLVLSNWTFPNKLANPLGLKLLEL